MPLLIQTYLKALQEANYAQLMHLFAEEAVVLSPLYGKCLAATFYKELFADTQRSELTFLDAFLDSSGQKIAVNFLYHWTLADGSVTIFDCVDIFELDKTGKIQQLKIIYDTAQTRIAFERLK